MFHTVCCFKLDYKLIFPAHIIYTLKEFCCIFYLTINPIMDPVATNFKEHEKPIATEVFKTFHAFCGTRTFIIISTRACYLGKCSFFCLFGLFYILILDADLMKHWMSCVIVWTLGDVCEEGVVIYVRVFPEYLCWPNDKLYKTRNLKFVRFYLLFAPTQV